MIKRFLLFLLSSLSLYAATYYVASTGSDSNPGSSSQPFLTIQHSVNSMACGDTLIVVANGSYVAGDANLPDFPNCGLTTTIQSSALAQFAPAGYRTNPTNDNAAYGKLSFTNQGIWAQPSFYTWNAYYAYSGVAVNTSTGQMTVICIFGTVPTCSSGNGLLEGTLANGAMAEFEPQSEASSNGNNVWPTINAPVGMSLLTKYYVIGCSASCGAVNSTFYLSATPGGSAIVPSSCPLYCITPVASDPTPGGSCTVGTMVYNPNSLNTSYCSPQSGGFWNATTCSASNSCAVAAFLELAVTTGVSTSTSTFTLPFPWTTAPVNGTSVAFAQGGLQVIGTLPAPLALDQDYYVINSGGSGTPGTPYTFQVAATPGGSPIPITSVGTGMLSVANTKMPSNWAFRGLEAAPSSSGAFPGVYFTFGSNAATTQVGGVSAMEIDRCYLHDTPGHNNIARAVLDNARYLNIHDSWISNGYAGEGQAIFGTFSPGPTVFTNNFLEAAGENTLYGGDWAAYPGPNANKIFQGNYFYKPPMWKQNFGTGAASGACLYDNTDPNRTGGEWYTNVSGGQVYQCNSSGVWATTGATPPGAITVKDLSEHKNGRYFSYIGNLYNGSFVQGYGASQAGEAWNNSIEFGSGPGMANDHIILQNNAAFNVYQMMERTSQCGVTPSSTAVCPIYPGNHVATNNLIVVNALTCGTVFNTGLCYYAPTQAVTGGVAPYFNGDSWNHNTIWTQDSFPVAGLSPMYVNSPNGACPPYSPIPTNLVTYSNSIVPGDFVGQCGYGVSFFYSNTSWANNALKNGTSSLYSSVGAGNSFTNGVYPGSNAAIGYSVGSGTNPANYKLAATSPFSAANGSATQLSTDGADLGADIDLVTMATSGAAAGTPPWPIMYRLNVAPGSTGAILSYTAPTSAACTVTVYNSHVRSPANVVATVADSTTASVSDGTTRYLVVPTSTLTASTPYWYGLACGGGVLMVGQFGTLAAGSGTTYFPFSFSSAQVLSYANNKAMTGATALPSSANPLVPVVTNTVVYVQQSGLTSPGGVQPVMAR